MCVSLNVAMNMTDWILVGVVWGRWHPSRASSQIRAPIEVRRHVKNTLNFLSETCNTFFLVVRVCEEHVWTILAGRWLKIYLSGIGIEFPRKYGFREFPSRNKPINHDSRWMSISLWDACRRDCVQGECRNLVRGFSPMGNRAKIC